MIGAFENIAVKTGYPVMNEIKASLLRSIVISLPDFVFDSTDDFKDKTKWIEGIKAENLFPLINIKQIDNDTETQEYKKSELGYTYPGGKGKYAFILKMNYQKDYHDYISSWSGKDFRVFLGDVNNSVIANLTGAEVKGLDVELFHVEKKQFGDKDPAWTQIKLILSDPDEYNLHTSMAWNPNLFNLVFITLSDISGSGNYVDFTIKDSVYGFEIMNLYAHDLTITDNAGGITIDHLTELSCGQYRITASGSLSYGTINVNSDRFYGSGNYYIVEDTVILNNYAFESDKKFQVDVRYSGSLELYGGLLQGDFTIIDDTNGAATITVFTEVSTGRYEITTDIVLTTGDIDIDDGTITGSGDYSVSIAIEIYDIVISETNEVTLKVRESISLAAVSGLVAADFEFSDTYNGIFTGLTESEAPAGTYLLTTDVAMYIGEVSVDTLLYGGIGDYENTMPYCENAGGPGATDWLNPTGGVAERFTGINPSYGTFSIITGTHGFTGNAQQIEKTTTDSGYMRIEGLFTRFKTGVDYKLKFKFYMDFLPGYTGLFYLKYYIYGESYNPVYLNDFIFAEKDTGDEADIHLPMYGGAQYWESDIFQFDSDEDYVYISFGINLFGTYIDIDEVQLIEV